MDECVFWNRLIISIISYIIDGDDSPKLYMNKLTLLQFFLFFFFKKSSKDKHTHNEQRDKNIEMQLTVNNKNKRKI